jgi:hypothetical protein
VNYKAQKGFIVVFCSSFMVVGAYQLAKALLFRLNEVSLAVGCGFIGIPLLIMLQILKQLSLFEKMSYKWYTDTYPEHVKGNRVSCFACGNARIQVRALMNQTYHRAHICAQCGETLYYSPERS